MKQVQVYTPAQVAENPAPLSGYDLQFLAQGDSWFSIGALPVHFNDRCLCRELRPPACPAESNTPDLRLFATPSEWTKAPGAERYLSNAGWQTFCVHITQVFNELLAARDSGENKGIRPRPRARCRHCACIQQSVVQCVLPKHGIDHTIGWKSGNPYPCAERAVIASSSRAAMSGSRARHQILVAGFSYGG
jgi:hypothetical protein